MLRRIHISGILLASTLLTAVAVFADVTSEYDRFEDAGRIVLSYRTLKLTAVTSGEPGKGFATHATASLSDATPISKVIFLLDGDQRITVLEDMGVLTLDADTLQRIAAADSVELAVYSGDERTILNFNDSGRTDLAKFVKLSRTDSPEAEEAREQAATQPSRVPVNVGGADDMLRNLQGRRMVFLVDSSGSTEGAPKAALRGELAELLKGLPDGQAFDVFAFNNEASSAFGKLIRATPKTKEVAVEFVTAVSSRGGNDGLLAAIDEIGQLRAQDIILFTDGGISDPDTVITELQRRLRAQRTTLHLVLYRREQQSHDARWLEALVRENGGMLHYLEGS